ncbi:DEAD/DEAH box helicase [Terasakiella pusilla]|uniref:DEAD/DEAH box helicase n=1 Tax=Terasakiella pusilla TaxID=64973 RepID=UPI00068B51E8|nr:DEAD/DEAH box helicase [Terasakiella pusilla]
MTKFNGVVSSLEQALIKRGYETLTPVQEAVTAPEMRQVDALVSAQTGSGKTVAFGLNFAPTILGDASHFSGASNPLALIIAPTRELALQVKRELEWLYEFTGAKIASCVGGMDMRTERNNLSRGSHIVVGTPGRLRDHIERGSLNTSELRCVVLDEADEMLDLGFRDELECILDTTPAERQTLMFSATVGRGIASLAKRYQRDAVRLETKAPEKQHKDIDYKAFTVAPSDRENAIINILRFHEARNTIIFCSTRATVNHLHSRLNNRGFSVVALSGELSQNERSHALQAMRDGRARVCVATDVAARGIDLPGLELVIHADVPRNSEALLHRSGRTGRAGQKGVSALVVPYNQRRRTERLLEHAEIAAAWTNPPSLEEVLKQDQERFLNNPAFEEAVQETEKDFLQTVMAKYSPEQIALALIRLQNTSQPAPEELLDAPAPRERGERGERSDRANKADRVDFENGAWVSLSIGRKHNAEPRWVLPMLLRAGHLAKSEIGSIKIQEDVTYVEFHPDSVEKFLAAVGPSRKVESGVTIDLLKEKPAFESSGPRRRGGGGGRGDKPAFGRKRDRDDRDPRPKKPTHRGKGADQKNFEERSEEKRSFQDDSPRKKKDFKPKGKKSYKPKGGGDDKGGMTPMKRKKKPRPTS